MKKFMFAAIAALAITSCSQNEEFEAPSQKSEITFGTIVKTSSRANVVTTDNFDTFVVSGYKTTDKMGTNVQLAQGFMDGVSVTKNKNNSTWESNTFYWPLSGKVQFFATSPAQTLNISSSGYPKFEYTVGDMASQKDLVVANLIDKAKGDGALVLPFQHLLTQVNFSIKGDQPGFTYTVTKLTLKGVNDRATFTFDGTDAAGTWGSTSASVTDLSYTYSGSVVVAPTVDQPGATTKVDASDANALLMLMPQTLAAGAQLEITYTAAPTDKPTEYTFNSAKTVALTGTWEKSKKIRYVLKLTCDASPVTFGDPTMGDWGDADPQPDEVVTPKP